MGQRNIPHRSFTAPLIEMQDVAVTLDGSGNAMVQLPAIPGLHKRISRITFSYGPGATAVSATTMQFWVNEHLVDFTVTATTDPGAVLRDCDDVYIDQATDMRIRISGGQATKSGVITTWYELYDNQEALWAAVFENVLDLNINKDAHHDDIDVDAAV